MITRLLLFGARVFAGARLLLLLVASTATYAQEAAELVKDINNSGEVSFSGRVNQLAYVGGYTFFVNQNHVWRTDGTPEGTIQLTFGWPGLTDIAEMTTFGTQVMFVATYPDWGREPFVHDIANTWVNVIDIAPGTASSSPTQLLNVSGTVYFTATDGVSGRELWKSLGMRTNTTRVKDILSGAGSSNPTSLEAIGTTVYFSANDATHGYELWKSGGTDASTVMVKDVRPGSRLSSTPKELTAVGSTLYFTAYDATNGRELWKSNGTAAGTILIKNIRAGSAESLPDNLASVSGTLYFAANDGINGRELWKSNGTSAGTVMVKDITPGSGSASGGGYPHLSYFEGYNGQLYFMAFTDRARIWKSDGTAAGTVPFSPVEHFFSGGDPNFTSFGGALFYVTDGHSGDTRDDKELWKSNGTASTLQQVAIVGASMKPDVEMTHAGNKMFLVGYDASRQNDDLWMTNGTAAGTTILRPSTDPISSPGSYPSYLVTGNNGFYFTAFYNQTQYGLFKSNGTAAGTTVIKEFPSESLRDLFYYNGYLYFIETESGTNNQVFWRSDGTLIGTVRVATLASTSKFQFTFQATGSGRVFFYQHNKLWSVTGTGAPTLLRTFPNDIGWIADANEELVFAANDGVRGLELWKSNGTVAGTVLLRDIYPGSSSALSGDPDDPRYPNKAAVTVNGIVYFTANAGGDANAELWKTDGVTAGMIKNDETGKPFNPLPMMSESNGTVYLFTRDEATFSYGLWKSNGTTAGTVRVSEVPFGEYTDQNFVTYSGASQFYFFLWTQYSDADLYTSDGTAEGTFSVWHTEWLESANPSWHAVKGDKIYIATGNPYEVMLFRSDGTKCGTYGIWFISDTQVDQKKDIYLTVYNNVLYLPGDRHDEFGMELYKYVDDVAPCADAVAARMDAARDTEVEQQTISSHPNPFPNELTLRVDGIAGESYRVQAMSMDGIEVEGETELLYNESYVIGRNWKPGIYVLKIQIGNGVVTRRVMKTD